MNYPLPDSDKCVYAYNSENAHVHGQNAEKIGRPGLYQNHATPNRWLKDMKNWNWDDKSKNIFDSSVIMRLRNGKARYTDEIEAIGPDRIETWLTKEERTGFLLGWEGCMAEDSQSFKNAFSAKSEGTFTNDDGATIEKFSRVQKTVPTKIMSGKLGDMAIRLGRYKLIRYNTPKDVRTGPTRQHLVDHEGKESVHNLISSDSGSIIVQLI